MFCLPSANFSFSFQYEHIEKIWECFTWQPACSSSTRIHSDFSRTSKENATQSCCTNAVEEWEAAMKRLNIHWMGQLSILCLNLKARRLRRSRKKKRRMDLEGERKNHLFWVQNKHLEIISFKPQMAKILLASLEYPHKYALSPRQTFPGAGGVQEGGK